MINIDRRKATQAILVELVKRVDETTLVGFTNILGVELSGEFVFQRLVAKLTLAGFMLPSGALSDEILLLGTKKAADRVMSAGVGIDVFS